MELDDDDEEEEDENGEEEVWPPVNVPVLIRDLLIEFKDVFVKGLIPSHHFRYPPMLVDLLDPSQTFHCGHPRQSPIHWNNTITSELQKLLEAGIIQKYDKEASHSCSLG